MWFDIAGACATLTLLLAATAVGAFWRISRQPHSPLEGLDEVQAQSGAAVPVDVSAVTV